MTDREEMFKTLSTEKKADAMDFLIERKPEPGVTFSKEALDEYLSSIEQYVVARVLYHLNAAGKDAPGPSNMKVEVRVTVNDEQYLPDDDRRPWFVIDGTHRAPVQ